MRFMIMVKATADSEAGVMPADDGLMAAMAAYHEELAKAGVLLAPTGCSRELGRLARPLSQRQEQLVDGPFTESKEIVGRLHADPGALARRGDRVGAALPGAVRAGPTARSRCARCSSSPTSAGRLGRALPRDGGAAPLGAARTSTASA